MRILIVGGYGVFGGRLAQLLCEEPQLTLIVAGRSKAQAQAFCSRLAAKAQLVAAVFDRDGDVQAQLRALAPDIVVDASGPFQTYGIAPYRLVDAAIALGIHYLDLADGSDFVSGIERFDARAKQAGVFVLCGVSSFPVLTAAVCRHLARDLVSIETITGGIAPSPYAGVGLNVIRAISSYAGKRIELQRDGRRSHGYGLTETRRYTIAPPGQVPVQSTLFSLVDVPDLKVLPQLWPGLRSIWMGAGPVPVSLHRGLIGLAWLVRLGLLPSLLWLAPVFHRAINVLRWGEHRGGMFVEIEGTTSCGEKVTRSWHLLAEGGDGPLIPSMAVAAIVRKCLAGERPASGARSAMAELELADYDRLFAQRIIYTGVREGRPGQAAALPLYQRILGPAWDTLPAPIRAMHDIGEEMHAEGIADVERGRNIVARLAGALFRFPPAGRNVPLRVHFVARDGGETWTRTFGVCSFASQQAEGRGRSDRLMAERFGPFSFGMALVPNNDRLCLQLRRWSVLGLPLPRMLAPFGDFYEEARDGRFHFNVEIRLPLVGLVVAYRGWLVPALR